MAKAGAKRIIIVDIALLVIVAIALAVSMVWSRDIELSLGLLYYADAKDVDPADVVVIDSKNGSYGVYASADSDAPSLKLHFVDVGQGDCTIIEFPDGKTMVIDGGDTANKYANAIVTYIENNLPEDFEYFDYAILTHPDADHCGSLDNVLNKYPARVAYRPNVEARNKNNNSYVDPGLDALSDGAYYKDTAAYYKCIDAMYAANDDFTPTVYVTDPADENQTISGGEGDNAYTYTFYSPLSYNYGTISTVDWNEYSPIMILEYRGFKFALSGDAEKENEKEFVNKVESAKTDGVTDKYDAFTDTYTVNLVKAGHHGSRTSTSQAYLDAITTPEGAKAAYYIISCGEGNSYKHPHSETLDRIAEMGVSDENILRTDVLGDILVSVSADENGVYTLRYGDRQTEPPESVDPPPITPEPIEPEPTEPEPTEPEPTEEKVLVYATLGGIKLKWAIVAWTWYAVLAVLALVHIALALRAEEKKSKSGSNGGNGGGRSHSGGARR